MTNNMIASIATPKISDLLNLLHADAAANDPLVRKAVLESGALNEPGTDFYKGMRKAYMAVPADFGHLLYNLARCTRAQTVVEFGTSFGVSTIYLASALRDNGGGRVITTEFEAEKVEVAKKNLTTAGLADLVEFRVGDALETLAKAPEAIDMIFLDGAKPLYLGVLKLLEANLRSGGVIASDNTDHDGLETFLEYIRNPKNGYTSSAILTDSRSPRGHEVTVRN